MTAPAIPNRACNERGCDASCEFIAGCHALMRVLVLAVAVPPTFAQHDTTSTHTLGRARDLQGTWDYWTFTPLDVLAEIRRARAVDRARIGVAQARREAAQRGGHAIEWLPATRVLTASRSGTDLGDKLRALTQTSIIVDPRDGRIPPGASLAAKLTKRAVGAQGCRRPSWSCNSGGPEAWEPTIAEDRGVAERRSAGFQHRPRRCCPEARQQQRADRSVAGIRGDPARDESRRTNHPDRAGAAPAGRSLRQWLGDSAPATGKAIRSSLQPPISRTQSASIALTGSRRRIRRTSERRPSASHDWMGGRCNTSLLVNDPAASGGDTRAVYRPSADDSERRVDLNEYACHEGNYGLANCAERSARQRAAGNAELSVTARPRIAHDPASFHRGHSPSRRTMKIAATVSLVRVHAMSRRESRPAPTCERRVAPSPDAESGSRSEAAGPHRDAEASSAERPDAEFANIGSVLPGGSRQVQSVERPTRIPGTGPSTRLAGAGHGEPAKTGRPWPRLLMIPERDAALPPVRRRTTVPGSANC